ncbi:MAG TPA: TIGR03086 family metal-binding protein [Pseudonocardia sp.]|nr:TIGR03086 family metal-binding protein [Pseudonocardia sp.]
MIDLTPACDTMIDLLGRITAEQLQLPTPCTEYTVRDVIEHIDVVAVGSSATARGDELSGSGSPAAAGAEDDWLDRVAKHVWEVGEAWRDPAAWRGSTAAAGVQLSNELWAMITLTELVVHGWDLTTATGRPYELAEPTLRACYEHVAEFVPNAPVAGLWGPPARVPGDAPLLDRLVAITGRTP